MSNTMNEILRKEAQTNPVFNAVAHVFALRERTRAQVTVGTLTQTMKKEGFDYEKRQLASVLEFLARTGVGSIEKDRRGRVQALKEIKLTLQSVGKAAVNKEALEGRRQRNRFAPLLAPVKVSAPSSPPPQAIEKPKADPSTLTVLIKGTTVSVSIPETFTRDDVIDLVNRLQAS